MNKERLLKLEAIRGFAALYVAIGHTFSDKLKFDGFDLSFFFFFGQEAVILFFFLSGFVIKYTYERSADKSFKMYFMKRFLRIYIPLLIIFGLNYLVQHIQSNGAVTFDGYNLLINLLMLQDISALKPNVVSETFLGNIPLWSLSYEWWFYMLFFFVVTRFKSKASYVIYALGILAALSYLIYPFFVNRILMYLLLWWIGADLAQLYLDKKEIQLQHLKLPLSALLVTIGILMLNVWVNSGRIYDQLQIKGFGISPMLELRHFSFGLVAVIGAVIWNRFQWKFFSNTVGIFTPFASISFALYISHYFVVSTATYLDFIVNEWLRYSCYFLICFAISYLIERVIYFHVNRFILFGMVVFKKSNR